MKKYLLKEHYRENIWWLILNSLVLIASATVRTIGVGNVGTITNEIAANDAVALVKIVAVSTVLILMSYVLRWTAGGICVYLGEKLTMKTRLRLMKHLEKEDFLQYESREKGAIQSIISNDVPTATREIYIVHSRILTNAYLYITSAWYMMKIDFVMGIIIILCSIFLGVVNHLILQNIKKYEKNSREALGEITNTAQYGYEGIETVQSYHAQNFIQKYFLMGRKKLTKSIIDAERVDSWRLTFYNIISNTAFFATMFYLGYKGIKGELEIGIVLSFLMILKQIMTPVEVILRWMTSLVRCNVSWKRIHEVLESPVEVTSQDIDVKDATINNEIFKDASSIIASDLSFAYDTGNALVFENQQITLEKGKVLVLKGESGSGKTTLVKLLLNLYHGDEGKSKLLVDGKPVPFESLKEGISFGEGAPAIFHMSIFENLKLGNEQITKEQCQALLKELNFADWIESMPEKLDTMLEENGSNISGGQRQIISVMRAILSDKPILILDEPFSALDKEHAVILDNYLEKLSQEKFVMVVSHREELFKENYKIVSL